MTTKPPETSQTTQANCWCGAIVKATTRPCPCGGRITVTEHGDCGMVITGPHSQDCTHVADNIDACATCGHNTQQCGGNNIFSERQDSCKCRTPAQP